MIKANSRLGAVLLALSLTATACGSGSPRASNSAPVVPVVDTEDTQPEDQTPPLADATPLVIGGLVLPGRYTTDLLGTEVTISMANSWTAPVADPGAILFVSEEQVTDTTEVVLVMRPTGLGSAADVATQPDSATLTGPSGDVRAWIEAAGELLVTHDEQTAIDGFSTRIIDVALDPAGSNSIPGGCGPTPQDRCFNVASTGASWLPHLIVRTTEVYRLWFIDQGAFDPILVAAIASEGNEGWLSTANEFVAGMSLGEPMPHPAPPPDGPLWEAGLPSVVPAGTVNLPALDGITFEMAEDRFIEQNQNLVAIISTVESESPMRPLMLIGLATERAPEPGPVIDAADFVSIVEQTATVTKLDETIEVFGKTLQGYSVEESPSADQEVLVSSARPGGRSDFWWIPGPISVMYVADAAGFASYDSGALVISMDAVEPDELEAARAIFDEILPTLASSG